MLIKLFNVGKEGPCGLNKEYMNVDTNQSLVKCVLTVQFKKLIQRGILRWAYGICYLIPK